MAKPPNYTVGARRSSRMSYVCYKKKLKSLKYPREIKAILWKSSKGKEISSEIHNSPWKSSVDEKGPMNFFNANNCMNAKSL